MVSLRVLHSHSDIYFQTIYRKDPLMARVIESYELDVLIRISLLSLVQCETHGWGNGSRVDPCKGYEALIGFQSQLTWLVPG
jgi:hypothetical protein